MGYSVNMIILLDRIKYEVTESGYWKVIHPKARRAGYPCIKIGGRKGKIWSAHRWVYTNVKGEIPEGLLVMHTCDNKCCVNPEHLKVGTWKDNLHDYFDKYGRDHLRGFIPPYNRGSKVGSAKLTEDQVIEIKKLLKKHPKDLTRISKQFGVTQRAVSSIRNGESWAWLKV